MKISSGFILLLFFITFVVCEYSNGLTEKEMRGKDALSNIIKKSQGSSCWMRAIEDVNEKCSKLDDDSKMRIAIAFTKCHMQQSGVEIEEECPTSSPVQECTKNFAKSNVLFNAYTEFYVHVDNICYFLEARNFQEKSEKTIDNLLSSASIASDYLLSLSNNADRMAKELEGSLKVQERLFDAQIELESKIDELTDEQMKILFETKKSFAELSSLSSNFIQNQNEILKLQEKLSEEQKDLSSLHSDTKNHINDVYKQTNQLEENMRQFMGEQNNAFKNAMMILEVITRKSEETIRVVTEHQDYIHQSNLEVSSTLDKISKLQSFLTLEYMDVQTLAFYIGAYLFTFLLTSTKYTLRLRFLSFVLLMITYAVEKTVIKKDILIRTFSSISSEVWFIRKIFLFIFITSLILSVLTYKDISKLNNSLLKEIKSSNDHLKSILSSVFDSLTNSQSKLTSSSKKGKKRNSKNEKKKVNKNIKKKINYNEEEEDDDEDYVEESESDYEELEYNSDLYDDDFDDNNYNSDRDRDSDDDDMKKRLSLSFVRVVQPHHQFHQPSHSSHSSNAPSYPNNPSHNYFTRSFSSPSHNRNYFY